MIDEGFASSMFQRNCVWSEYVFA